LATGAQEPLKEYEDALTDANSRMCRIAQDGIDFRPDRSSTRLAAQTTEWV